MIDVTAELQLIVDQLNPLLKVPFRLHVVPVRSMMTIQITGTADIQYHSDDQLGYALVQVGVGQLYETPDSFLSAVEIWVPTDEREDLSDRISNSLWIPLSDKNAEDILFQVWGKDIFLSPLELIAQGEER